MGKKRKNTNIEGFGEVFISSPAFAGSQHWRRLWDVGLCRRRAVEHAEEERLKTTPPPVRLSEGVSGLDCFWVIGLARGLALMGCCWTPLGCAGGLHGQVIW
jgi:hypothetical protein